MYVSVDEFFNKTWNSAAPGSKSVFASVFYPAKAELHFKPEFMVEVEKGSNHDSWCSIHCSGNWSAFFGPHYAFDNQEDAAAFSSYCNNMSFVYW